jgi:hypothetical protein
MKNCVKYLQGINFPQLSLAEKTAIKNLVCLTPDLVISQASLNRIQTYMRTNNCAVYTEHVWSPPSLSPIIPSYNI